MGQGQAVVVGGGISGLLAALVLARNGYSVTVLEKEIEIGGACRSYRIDGYTVDTGPHVITKLRDGPLTRIMSRYFTLVPNFVEHEEYHVRKKDGSLRKLPLDIFEFLSTDIIPKRDKPKVAVALTEGITKMMMDPEKMNVSLWSYIKKYRLTKQTLKLVDAIAYFLTGVSMKECPAWRFFKGGGFWIDDEDEDGNDGHFHIVRKIGYFKKAMVHDRFPDHGYPLGGIGSITKAVEYSLKECGATINTEEEVKRINVDGRRVVSIETNKDEYKPDVVVYAAELIKLPSIMSDMPTELKKKIRTLKHVEAIVIWLGFEDKKGYFDYRGSEVYYEGRTPFWAVCTSNFDPSLAPKGKRLVGFGSVIRGKKSAKDYEKSMLDEIFSVFNGIEESVEMKHTQILRPEKAAVTVKAEFPGVANYLDNMFFVGTDVDQRSMGITKAAHSVISMAKAMNIW